METLARDDPKTLQDRLKEPQTVELLHRLLDQLDTLEQVTLQAPAFIAMAGDTLDTSVQKAAASGIQLNERLHNLGTLAERFSRKESADQFERLLELADQAPGLIAMMADTVDGLMQRAHHSGIDVNEHISNALGLAQRLTDSATVAQLNQALDRAQEVPGFISMMVDTLDSYSRQAQAQGRDLEKALSHGLGAALRLSAKLTPERVSALEKLLDHLDENALQLAEVAADALQNAQQSKTKVSAFGLVGKLSDPEIQKALGFLTSFAKQFGKSL